MNDSSRSGESAARRRFKRHGRGVALAALLGAGLALGGCSTMSDIGEATSDGVSTAANAMNPFNWFGGKDGEAEGAAAESAKQERAVANTATKTGVKSAGRDDLAQRQAAAQDEDRYPKLSTVPERPKDAKSKRAAVARAELREGLVADTANAQYTDKELRAQTASAAARGAPQAAPQAAPKGQPDLARSNERVGGEPPAQPAPTMPVAAAPAAPLRAAPAAPPEPPKPMAAAPVVPRVAPPAAVRPQARSGGSSQRQAAAASAAPVSPVAPRTAAPSAAPRVAPPAAPSRQAALAQPAPDRPQSVLKTEQVATIYFNDGSARLSPDDKQVVGKIAEVVRQTGGTLRIVGHSSMGPPSRDPDHAAMVNYKVSLDRAKAVAEALLRSGVPESQLQVMAEGARSPIYAETSRTGAAGNRRTEVYLDYREQL